MTKAFVKLNTEQQAATEAIEGKVCLVAGAGSGKTRVLSERFAFLVNEVGIAPGNILCVTFTNKAADEMKRRIRKLTGDNDTGMIYTFHGLCNAILKEDINEVHYPKEFRILDGSDVRTIFETIYDERALTSKDMKFNDARKMISARKNTDSCPPYYIELTETPLDGLKQKYDEASEVSEIIYYGYLYHQRKIFGLDYDDLMQFTLYIFGRNDDICEKWQQRMEYIMIDEFQDIDSIQVALMDILAGYHHNLFIVGDPDQTIYSWRGAKVQFLLNFSARCDVNTIIMNQNYRSTPQILSVANSLIEKNTTRIKKELVPMRPDGDKVCCHVAETKAKEADWIAQQIKEIQAAGVSLNDVAVLYRAHACSHDVERSLQRENLPYKIHSGQPFFERREIKTAIEYLRMILYQDDLSFLQTSNRPGRSIGKKSIERITAYSDSHNLTLYATLKAMMAASEYTNTKANDYVNLIDKYAACCKEMKISDLFSSLLDESGYEEMLRRDGEQERIDNLALLKQEIYEYESTYGEKAELEDYLTHVALLVSDEIAAEQGKVNLMTVHAAKGLEFPYVFVCCLNDGVFPSKKTKSKEGMEEERRLAFVAMTRAEKKLYLTMSEGYTEDGPIMPSRFITDIDHSLLEYTSESVEAAILSARKYGQRFYHNVEPSHQRFLPGQKIIHKYFGQGTILDVASDRQAYVIKFDEQETPRSITFSTSLEPAE